MTKEEVLEYNLKSLDESLDTHLQIALKTANADKGNIYPLDLFVAAVTKRSMSLITGFTTMLKDENFICAAAILRLQIDNLIRLYASTLVDKPHDFAVEVLSGVQIRKMKDRDGNKMTDRYLVDQLSKMYDWIDRLYQETSGYIHLSEKHIFNVVSSNRNDSSIQMSISQKDTLIPIEHRIEATLAMATITKNLLQFLHDWYWTKDNPVEAAKLREDKRRNNKSNG